MVVDFIATGRTRRKSPANHRKPLTDSSRRPFLPSWNQGERDGTSESSRAQKRRKPKGSDEETGLCSRSARRRMLLSGRGVLDGGARAATAGCLRLVERVVGGAKEVDRRLPGSRRGCDAEREPEPVALVEGALDDLDQERRGLLGDCDIASDPDRELVPAEASG